MHWSSGRYLHYYRMLREEVSDPRVRLVTITRVDVAPDLSNAVMHYSVMDIEPENGGYRVLADPAEAGRLNRIAADAGILLRRVVPRSETLEDVFLRMTAEPGDPAHLSRAA